jgi:hypothetical protein
MFLTINQALELSDCDMVLVLCGEKRQLIRRLADGSARAIIENSKGDIVGVKGTNVHLDKVNRLAVLQGMRAIPLFR